MSQPLELIAHRGASHDAPENTVAAARLAWRQGADAVEVDVRLTADGELVVIHDAHTRRTTGEQHRVAETTLAELRQLDASGYRGVEWSGEPIPTLTEVVATVPADRRLLVEVKCGVEAVDPLMRVIDATPDAPRRITVISYTAEVLAAVKRLRPETIVYLVARFDTKHLPRKVRPLTIRQLIAVAADAGFDGLDLHAAGPLTRASVRQIKLAGLACLAWTVDDPQHARRLIDLGVEGIATNRPGWLREQLG